MRRFAGAGVLEACARLPSGLRPGVCTGEAPRHHLRGAAGADDSDPDAFSREGDTILVERPSYDLYLRLLELEGVPVGTVHRSAEGLDLDQLEERFKRGGIKFFYTMTRYHNPLGTSLLAEERRAVAELAGKYGVYIVEDDYMSDLGLERRADPIHAYDSSAHVIYLKSFSKIIFPGPRVGAAVLPERLLPAFQTYKRLADLNTSFLSQAALEIYIKNGMYQRHRHKISSMYTERMHALHQALKEADRDGRIEASNRSPGLGVYTQFKLSPKVNLDRLVKRLASRNIRVLGGQAFYLADYAVKDKFLRMSISRARPEQIRIGIEALLEELKKLRLG
ncbi:PLP-dependent aminotransferase family protein [Paenibacillus sp. P26]|nr:PLP-dependent aminotransferase family protein [Paenibacillus sp. P26]